MPQSDPTSNRPVPEGPGRFAVPGWIWKPGVLILAVVVGLVTAGALLNARANRLDVRLHASRDDGRTLLVVGIDDRSLAPEGTTDFGELGDEHGARADLILALHRQGGQIRAASIPRDLVVEVAPNEYDRLATSWLRGPQAFVDGLCRSLAMPVDHVVVVNLRGFVTLVDAVGGVDVTLEHPLRDEHAHIDLPAGTQRLDGRTALGFVRSRQGEILVDGTWTADPEGAAGRQRRGGEVFRALQGRLPRNPVTLYSLAWRTLPETSLSDGTSLLDLAGFRDLPGDFARIPVEGGRDADDWVATVNDQTRAALAETGLAGGCSV
ncbi:LytR family transcriptional regulator [Arachnia propionica]|uniref:LCP family protein n=1 Tax=Arachnia propionica TaxID=1750 RepID=A0AB37HXZ3_9ACTN|nr:LCP family protein [Arachnia propionica]QCT38209.1 LytR family transcriptional regulator [Arachnia propionica]QUC12205.1 LCP family protein [Arachnia propionica]RPA19007.1 LytR family transcriptional regulator [Arachnia propionica]